MTREELAAVVKGTVVGVRRHVDKALDGVTTRLAVLAVQITQVADATKDLSGVRERVAVLETRAPVPGPAGPPGKDGADGLGFDDLAIEQIDDTTVTVKAIRGDQVKVIGTVTFPVMAFKRDYEPGHAYTPGNLVRFKRAMWHCHTATSLAPDAVTHDASGKPAGPQGKDFWTLVLSDGKRGADGKDGQAGPSGKPGRDWQQVYDDTRRR